MRFCDHIEFDLQAIEKDVVYLYKNSLLGGNFLTEVRNFLSFVSNYSETIKSLTLFHLINLKKVREACHGEIPQYKNTKDIPPEIRKIASEDVVVRLTHSAAAQNNMIYNFTQIIYRFQSKIRK